MRSFPVWWLWQDIEFDCICSGSLHFHLLNQFTVSSLSFREQNEEARMVTKAVDQSLKVSLEIHVLVEDKSYVIKYYWGS